MIRAIIVITLLLSTLFSKSENLEKVSVQLLWLHQFEFAGFYIAKEKGFYKNLGLDVELKEYQFGLSIVDDVMKQNSTFGVSNSTLIVDKEKGKDIVALTAIFQNSPLILIATQESKIKTAKDLRGKRVMASSSETNNASILTMLLSQGVRHDEVKFLEHSFDVEDLINNQTDLMTAYISNQPFVMQEREVDINIINPKDYGFDFYADMLFTTKENIIKNPEMVENFRQATLEGYKYAFENIEESVDLILEKYNTQNKSREALIYEGKTLKKLAMNGENVFGSIEKEKLYKIASTYNILGIIEDDYNLESFIYIPTKEFTNELKLTNEEKLWLSKHPEIRLGIDNSWPPFEYIDKNGEYKGMAADYLKIVEKKLGVKFKIDKNLNWNNTLKKAQTQELDMLSCLVESSKRREYLDFTQAYLDFPMVILTSDNVPYIRSVEELMGKKVVVVKNYISDEYITKNYPTLNLIRKETFDEAVEMVASGDAYALIGNVATSTYSIKRKGYTNLKVSGILSKSYSLSIGVRKDWEIFKDILEKTLNSISEKEKETIYNKWINLTYEVEFDYSRMWKISLGVLVLVLFIIYWNRTLTKEIKRRKLAEDKLKKFNSDLEEKVNKAVEEIEKQNAIIIKQSEQAAMGELISVIAHQIKQPLNSVAIRVQELQDLYDYDELNEESVDKFIKDNMEKIHFLGKTVDNFREFFKPNKQKRPFKIATTIEMVKSLLFSQLEKNSISIVIDIKEDSEILSYPSELQHVLMNIVNNAKDALIELNVQDPTIWITLEKKEKTAVISVEDNAGGISDSIKDKIFNSYFSTKGDKGTGIGLHLSKMIIEDHMEGSISVVNKEHGACFKIELGIN